MTQKRTFSAEKFISSIAKFSISSWTNLITGFFFVVVTTRLFSPEVCGTLNLFNTIVAVLAGVTAFGFDSAFSRFFYEPPAGWNVRELFTRCLLIAVIFLLILSFVSLYFFATDISNLLFQRASFFLTALLLLKSLSYMVLTNFLAQFYRYSNDSFHYTIQQVLMQILNCFLVVGAALIDPRVEMVLSLNTVGFVVLMVIYLWVQREDVFAWRSCTRNENMQEVYRFAFYSWPSGVAVQVSAFVLPYMISALLDASSLGIYASAGAFVAAFNALQGGFRTYWAAFMYKHYKGEQEVICKIHSYVVVACIFLMAGLVLFQHTLYLLIGSDFQESRLFFALILIPPLLGLWEQTTFYGIVLSKKNQQRFIIDLVTLGINLVFSYILILSFGLIGAAFSVVASEVIRFILLTWRGQVYYRSIRSIWETLVGMFLLLLMGGSNTFFYEKYWEEVVTVFLLLILTVLVYRRSFVECITFLAEKRCR